jgi:prepilin-type N-terminal cleavage/methylation domain-containing protein
MWPSRALRAFTIVEVMVVVAILGVLSALAVGNYHSYKLKAARAELMTNVNGIRIAQTGYEASDGTYVTDLTPLPDNTPGKSKRPWIAGTVYDTLGWVPDGELYGSYTTENLGTDFAANGYTDVDTDAVMAQVTASRAVLPLLTTPDSIY